MTDYGELISNASTTDTQLQRSSLTPNESRKKYYTTHPYPKRYRPLPFCGVDGEGGNHSTIAGTEHRYYVLRAGDRYLYTGAELRTEECLSYIGNLPRGYCYCGFFFNYDVTMMLSPLAGFPIEKIGELVKKDLRKFRRDGQPFPVRWKDYEIEYIPSKRFTVGLIDPITNKTYQSRTIHDVSGFFQCSFVKALETWGIGSNSQLELIKRNKELRSVFTEQVTEEELEYSHMECMLLAELMEKLREAAREAEVPITQYEGAGCFAGGLMSKHKISRYSVPLNDDVQSAAQSAYFGGRFEVTGIGHYKKVYQYDINSAYPRQIYGLPCLAHGTWNHADVLPDDSIGLIHLTWKPKLPTAIVGAMPLCGPLPFRSRTGRIYYPLEGKGWYWSDEVKAALNAKQWEWDIDVLEVWSWQQSCNHRPFSFVPSLYKKRKMWGKDGKGIVIKLALNSLYGKTAQSVGRPRFANPVWAGLITARTRALIYSIVEPAESDILMIATDGIFSLRPLDVPISDKLGEWSVKEYENFFIVQPGIYFGGDELADASKSRTKRTRGVPANKLTKEEFTRAWAKDRDNASVTIPMSIFVGLRSGYHMGHYESIGQWENQTRNIRFSPFSKIVPEKGTWQDKRHMRLLPWPVCSWQEESTPYDRSILPQQDRQTELMWEEDQPDYSDYMELVV